MNKKFGRARIVVDVEKQIHKHLKTLAVEEESSLRSLMLEAIELLLAKKAKAKKQEL